MFLMTGKNFPGSIINNFLSDNLYFFCLETEVNLV